LERGWPGGIIHLRFLVSRQHSDEPDSAFPSTGWTLIRAVQDRSRPEQALALDRFARLYWQPVFCFLRARGLPAAEAEDLAQEFFVSLLDGNWIDRADPQRGRFRAFLRMHLRSFLADRTSPRRLPRQKQFERQFVSLDGLAGAADRSWEPAAGETPEQAFDRAFARALVRAVRQELRTRSAAENLGQEYDVFTAAFPEDSLTEQVSQQALAERFGKTRDEVRGILDRMKKRCLRLLRNELRDHGGNEDDIQAEATELLNLLSSQPGGGQT
jgi:RNA polymerase sigma-70 factor (ECF subfamily)